VFVGRFAGDAVGSLGMMSREGGAEHSVEELCGNCLSTCFGMIYRKTTGCWKRGCQEKSLKI
jgi:hypothetical protein